MDDKKDLQTKTEKLGDGAADDVMLFEPEKRPIAQVLRENPYIVGLACFATLGGFLFGYDQGVVSGILTMESFGAKFPRIYMDSGFKGWFTSSLLLAAWLGSLINGPVSDKFGRKHSILFAVVIFVSGSAIQAGAVSIPMLFVGRTITGIPVGMLTMVTPQYLSEISVPTIRGTLVVLQQLSITIGILVSYWLEYGTHYIGGTRCDPTIPYSGGMASKPTFDAYHDVGPNGCTGQSEASWRVPFALQIFPALVLGIGMLFYPESPRWWLMVGKDQKALDALSRIRRLPTDDHMLSTEFLAIKADVLFEQSYVLEHFHGWTGIRLMAAQYLALVSTWPNFRRLSIGSCIMFFQQFMGCNAMIYYAPTIFGQLGLSGNTTSLLATGVYGIVNTLWTLPALFLIDKVGRRPLLMCGALGTFISLVIVGGIVGGYGSNLAANKAAGWTGIAFIYIYDINFSYSFAPIGWVLPSEIFNLGNRSKAMSITTSSTWMCNFIIGLVTPDMLSTIKWGTYIFFAAFCLLALAFTYFFVPETKGRSLEDMDLVFGDNAAHEEKAHLVRIAQGLRIEAEQENRAAQV
ncbi:general substrate transporter [Rhizodiscina lignyota]|uniref:General substrate transporter n=1 Tax=Rhizodiscina lignyota TaxID=1504668 RepID=A0A9P4ISM0_9PEZI|nr:general substrate transporter [Rhizodiscina lignyota]